MDTFILTISIVIFFAFLLSLAIIFRLTPKEASVVWVVRVFCFYLIAGICFHPLVAVLYGLMGIVFIFAVFSVLEASLTIRLLVEIVLAGNAGISLDNILVRFNKKRIVERRIERLLWSGDIVRTNRGYRLVRRISYFQVRERFLLMLQRLFPVHTP